MSRYALVTDDDLRRARQDPEFRHQLLAGNLEFLLEELNRLRRAGPDPRRKRQIKEGVELAVKLADLLHRMAAPSARAS
jgi:hypothetical protein